MKLGMGWIARRAAVRAAGRGLAATGRGVMKASDLMQYNKASYALGRAVAPATRKMAKVFKPRITYSKATMKGRMMRGLNTTSTRGMRSGMAFSGAASLGALETAVSKGLGLDEPTSEELYDKVVESDAPTWIEDVAYNDYRVADAITKRRKPRRRAAPKRRRSSNPVGRQRLRAARAMARLRTKGQKRKAMRDAIRKRRGLA